MLPVLVAAAVGAAVVGVLALRAKPGRQLGPPPPANAGQQATAPRNDAPGQTGGPTPQTTQLNQATAPAPHKDNSADVAKDVKEAVGLVKLDAASFVAFGAQVGDWVAHDIAQTQAGKTAAAVAGASQGVLMGVICAALSYSGAVSGVAAGTLGLVGLAVCVAIIDVTIIVTEMVDTIGTLAEEAKEPARKAFLENLIAQGRLREAAAFAIAVTPGASINFRCQPPQWGDADEVTLSEGPYAGETFSADAMLKYAFQPCWDAYYADTRDHKDNPTGRKHRDAAREDFLRAEGWCRVLGGSPWSDGKGSTFWGGWAPWNNFFDLVTMYGPPNEAAHTTLATTGKNAGATQVIIDAKKGAAAVAAAGKNPPSGAAGSAGKAAGTSSARETSAVATGKTGAVTSTDTRNTTSTGGGGSSKPGTDSTKRSDA